MFFCANLCMPPTHQKCLCCTTREEFTKKMAAFVKMIRPDDQGFTTIENIRDGLAPAGNKKPDTGSIHETEWVRATERISRVISI